MIDPDKRKAIFVLHQEGMGARQIARRLRIGRNTVRAIISQKGAMPEIVRQDKIDIDTELLIQLYGQCQGWVQRIHEKLTEEHGVEVGYSTLTRILRDLNLGNQTNQRCDQVPDKPGAEMQHDTSPYTPKIDGKPVSVVASLIYLRYSKMRYLKFYRSFNHFQMKCFLHEALMHWGYAAPECIIDNTNLARLRGSGKNAVICHEMAQFSKRYGFDFVCHEINHSNRKAGNERSFFTVETNFFPGRKFTSLEDMNQQALHWATIRMPNRPVKKTGLIPAKAFEYERVYLKKLPPYVEPPYLDHIRGTDQYGYCAFAGNYYWIPGTSRPSVKVLQYSDFIRIYHNRKLLITYPLPPHGTKNKKFSPKGLPAPKHGPANRRRPPALEEKCLRQAAEPINSYLNFALKEKGIGRNRFIRQLYALYQKTTRSLFVEAVQRALKYRVADILVIERIIILVMRNNHYQEPFVTVDPDYENRKTYLEGCLTDEIDPSLYDEEE
jgi:transposase